MAHDQLPRRRLRTKHRHPARHVRLPAALDVRRRATPTGFVNEVQTSCLKRLPKTGLIIDLRANPGGYIDTAEQAPPTLHRDHIEPARFACRATAAMVEHRRSRRQRARPRRLGRLHPRRTRPRRGVLPTPPHQRPRRAATRSPDLPTGPSSPSSTPTPSPAATSSPPASSTTTSDTIIAVGDATGAGGANVWNSDDIAYAYHAAATPDLPPLPPRNQLHHLGPTNDPHRTNPPDSPSKTSASPATTTTP